MFLWTVSATVFLRTVSTIVFLWTVFLRTVSTIVFLWTVFLRTISSTVFLRTTQGLREDNRAPTGSRRARIVLLVSDKSSTAGDCPQDEPAPVAFRSRPRQRHLTAQRLNSRPRPSPPPPPVSSFPISALATKDCVCSASLIGSWVCHRQ